MAKVLRFSQSNINKIIHRRLNLKTVKKFKVHRLTPENIDKRKKIAFKLYMKLNKGKWQKYITTDEAWFYISDTNGITKIQYISRSQKHAEIGVDENRELHPKGIIVWAGISYFGKTNFYFIDPHTRINSDYYVNHVFKKKNLAKMLMLC